MKRIKCLIVLWLIAQFSLLGNNQSVPFEIVITMDSTSSIYMELEKQLNYTIQETILKNTQFELKRNQDSAGHKILIEVFGLTAEKQSGGYVGKLDLNIRITDDTDNLIFTKNLNYNSLSRKVDKLSSRVASFGLKKPEKLSNVQGKLLPKSSVELIQSFLKSFKIDLNICLTELYPACVPVVEIVKEKNGEAQNVLILMDRAQDMKKGDELELIKVVKIDYQGKIFTRKEPFGKIKVENIEGDFAKCKVVKGKKQVLEYLKANQIVMAQKKVKKDNLTRLLGLAGL